VPPNAWRVSREEFNHYLSLYDQAGLSEGEIRRLELLYQPYPKPDLVLASDLPRARDTARVFARGAEIIIDPVLREVPVKLPDHNGSWFLSGRWPGEVWWSYLRLAWFRGRQAETPDASRERAHAAIAFLLEHQRSGQSVAVVSHSGFLLILVDRLHRQKTISGPRFPSIDFGRPTAYHQLGQLEPQAKD
jgi:broad specificity phosphatase PhoE